METSVSIYFSEVKDPRTGNRKQYPLEEILLVALCSIMTAGEGFDDMVLFGENRLDFLRQFYAFEFGIPSQYTFRRVFMLLDPVPFQECFAKWVASLQDRKCEHIAIDGKVARRSYGEDQKALHMVSAFASESGLVMAQRRVEDKTNEITAIPHLLDILDIEGSIVSIDAMGCQKSIAEKVIKKKGNYVLALKGNQGELHKEVREVFEGKRKAHFVEQEESSYKTLEKGHGRIEEREYRAISLENMPINVKEWNGIKSIIEVKSTREIKGKKSEEKRYYISSLSADAQKIGDCIRSHWAIENSLHWVLDMNFNEDQSRAWSENAAENLGMIRHISINLLKKVKDKRSIRLRQRKAAINHKFLSQVLGVK